MARALLIAYRDRDSGEPLRGALDSLNRALAPDNIVPRKAEVRCADGVSVALLNPTESPYVAGTSVAVGTFFESRPDWHVPGAAVPDGSFALLRADAERVELIADAAGSRTIWYVLNEEMLIASTSQRAIIALLGSFELNRRVLPWLLSNGTLGAGGGWDQRLEPIRRGEHFTLDRARWRISRSVPRISFEPDYDVDDTQHAQYLVDALGSICRDWRFDPGKWLLPLSGGTDSRGLLTLLKSRAGLRTITWGRSAARGELGNDGRIAAEVAARFGVENKYLSTDYSVEPRERLLDRFLSAGEGRVAKISGYLDGFRLWKALFEQGVDGVIRGDEAFGSMAVRDAYGARFTANATLLTDFFSPAQIASFDLPEQSLPHDLIRRSGETLPTWRDRMYQEFRIASLLAGLNELKAAYVEIANPLLAGKVLSCTRRLPDELRTNKRLWRELVTAAAPDIPYARAAAVLALDDFVNDPSTLELMLDELLSARASDVFGGPLLRKACANIETALSVVSAKRAVRARRGTLHERLRTAVRSWGVLKPKLKPKLNPLLFAFRAFIAVRMNGLLKADSAALAHTERSVANL